jgi:hypothetical protein
MPLLLTSGYTDDSTGQAVASGSGRSVEEQVRCQLQR